MSTPALNTAPSRDSNVTSKTPSKTPVHSPARRVLGDLTPKAINTPQSAHQGADTFGALKATSPLKQVQTMSQHAFMDAENIPRLPVSKIGRKRSIYEVDGAVTREETMEKTPRRNSKHEGLQRDAYLPSPTENLYENTPTVIVDDASTEENTPEPDEEQPVSQETSVSKASFSSLINYNPHGSSQLDPQGAKRAESPDMEDASRKKETTPEDIKSRAETLRLRLSVAIYKVKTNQTKTPMSQLTVQHDHPPRAASPSIPARILSPVHESAAAAAATTNLKLLPAPVLLPTAYSSRMITAVSHLPSSPPAAGSPERLKASHTHPTTYTTPPAQRTWTVGAEAEGEDGEVRTAERVQQLREKRFEEGDLTSSAVKGRAASGLLELKNGR